MGRIEVKVSGLSDILGEYIGNSLIEEAVSRVNNLIKCNTEVTVHVQRMQEEATLSLMPGDIVDLHHHFEITLLLSRDPVSITEEVVS